MRKLIGALASCRSNPAAPFVRRAMFGTRSPVDLLLLLALAMIVFFVARLVLLNWLYRPMASAPQWIFHVLSLVDSRFWMAAGLGILGRRAIGKIAGWSDVKCTPVQPREIVVALTLSIVMAAIVFVPMHMVLHRTVWRLTSPHSIRWWLLLGSDMESAIYLRRDLVYTPGEILLLEWQGQLRTRLAEVAVIVAAALAMLYPRGVSRALASFAAFLVLHAVVAEYTVARFRYNFPEGAWFTYMPDPLKDALATPAYLGFLAASLVVGFRLLDRAVTERMNEE